MSPSQSIVAVDSMILAWSLREEGGSEDQRTRTRWLFDQLEAEKCQIIVPTVVVAEFLVPLKAERHTEMLAAMTQRFILAPFDARCAALAAEILGHTLSARPTKGEPGSKHSVKVDAMMVATAKVWSASRVFSNDAGCRELARRLKMDGCDLPTQPNDLFGFAKSRAPELLVTGRRKAGAGARAVTR